MAAGKTYRTIHANSSFVVQKMDAAGKPLQGQCDILRFSGNTLYTEDPAAIAQLDACVATPGSPIFTNPAVADALKRAEALPAAENVERAAAVVEAIAKTGARPS